MDRRSTRRITVGERTEAAVSGGERGASEQQSADQRVGEAVRLDGNAAAGILSEVFVQTSRRRGRRAPTAKRSGRWVRRSSPPTAWVR